MQAANSERFHLYHSHGDPVAPFLGLLAGTLGLFVCYQATNQVMIQRVLAVRSTWDGIMGIIFAGFTNLFRPLVTRFLSLIVYHYDWHGDCCDEYPATRRKQMAAIHGGEL
jgi:solute:Na+ symporter, SSS family